MNYLYNFHFGWESRESSWKIQKGSFESSFFVKIEEIHFQLPFYTLE